METGKYINPSEEVRKLMIIELENDLKTKLFYVPKTIHQDKIEEYKEILKEFFKTKSLNELIQKINNNFINRSYKYIKNISHETLAEGEWDKYYQKALCQKAIPNNKKVKIIRWKTVDKPKYLIGFTEGTKFDSKDYYSELMKSQFHPLGPNSGLTIEIID
ncbi:hypothetical protein GOV12_01485 [Candidatus Pacearchaeota archaeon]|nr:hypothetical protein [Candidatus Pacearchaeota archaeon]